MPKIVDNKKLSPWMLIALSVVILALVLWIFTLVMRQARNNSELNLEQKFRSAPSLALEPAKVNSYGGLIKSIDKKNNQLTLVTVRGEKIVQFDNQTTWEQANNGSRPDQPPQFLPLLPEPTKNNLTMASVEALAVGDLAQATSLTNIRGLATFKAQSIIFIKK